MARKHQLRAQRAGTVINTTSAKQETDVIQALRQVESHLRATFGRKIVLVHEKQWALKEIVEELRLTFPEVGFHHHFDTSSIRPDGGILFIEGPPATPSRIRSSSPR